MPYRVLIDDEMTVFEDEDDVDIFIDREYRINHKRAVVEEISVSEYNLEKEDYGYERKETV